MMRSFVLASFGAFVAAAVGVGSAAAAPAAVVERSASQQECEGPARRYCEELERLAAEPAVRRALEHLEATDDDAVRDLITLTEIPAPPFMEERRGKAYAEMLREAGADSVWIDAAGNVIALREGRPGGRVLAISGHLDTVFPEGTDVTVEQRGDTLFAPGIGDDTRGLVVVLQTLRALEAAEIETEADVLFIGTVGEEGLGDLRGVKQLFGPDGPKIDAFISVDGSDDERIVNQALGSRRYRVTFKGPGGHSWGAFGTANPAHALGRAIRLFDEAADRFTADGARTSYNVGRIGGGTSINSVPFEAWMEVDMRSESQARLMQIDSIFRAVVQTALEQQNEVRRRGPALTVDAKLVGDRPSGETDPEAPLVLRAAAATYHFGGEPRLQRSSTDSNVPISMGIPAITIGGGGESHGSHSPGEWWMNRDGVRGIQRALLIVLAEAGLAGEAASDG
ncbi:MAG TPA: M20/M25/M40 family metallo-hydrolase [Longimicrobiales bacterium]